MTEIVERLLPLADEKYRAFHAALTPGVPADSMIGVRIPALRELERKLARDKEFEKDGLPKFLSALPHDCYEENILHALFICDEKDFCRAVKLADEFLPYANCWTITDILLPKAFKRSPEKLLPHIYGWLESGHTYTARFGVNMLRANFLDDNFDPSLFDAALNADREDYYVAMAVAWYFCDALIKRYDDALAFLSDNILRQNTKRMLIGKIRDTFRLNDTQKAKATGVLSSGK